MLDNYSIHKLGDLTIYLSKSISDEMTSAILATNAGSINDSKKGLAHFVEHMLFNGTESYSKDYINNDLYQFGITDLNAFTSYNWIATCGSSLSKYTHKLIDILFELMNKPRFPEEYLEKERQIITQEFYSSRDSIGGLLSQDFIKQLYLKNKYSEPIIGNEKDIKNIQLEDLINYHQSFFSPYQQVLILRTNIDWKKIKSILLNYYSSVNHNLKQFYPNQKFILKGNDSLIKIKKFNQTGLIYSYPFNPKDWTKINLICEILSGGLGSKLMREVREKRGLTYSISANFMIFKESGLFYVETTFSDNSRLEELKEVIRKCIKESITEKELSDAKNVIKIELLKSNYSISGCSFSVLNRITSNNPLDFNQVYNNIDLIEKEELNSYKKNIQLFNGNFYVISC